MNVLCVHLKNFRFLLVAGIAQFSYSQSSVDFCLFLNYTRIHYDYKIQSVVRGYWSSMGWRADICIIFSIADTAQSGEISASMLVIRVLAMTKFQYSLSISFRFSAFFPALFRVSSTQIHIAQFNVFYRYLHLKTYTNAQCMFLSICVSVYIVYVYCISTDEICPFRTQLISIL